MDSNADVLTPKTLGDRIRKILGLFDQPDRIQKIADYSGLDRTSIDRYLQKKQAMRLYNIGLLIYGIQRFIRDDANNEELANEITIKKLATGLSDDEYFSLRTTGDSQLVKKLSEKISQTGHVDCRTFQNKEYAFHIMRTWEEKEGGEDRLLHELYVPLRLKGGKTTADEALDCWVRAGNGQGFLLLLGDIGIGKTTTLLHFAAKQAQRHLEDPPNEPLPVYIDLKNYRRLSDIGKLLGDLLFKHFRYIPEISRVDDLFQLARQGRVVFILDGFDEMAIRLSDELLFEHLIQIERLYSPTGKLLLSARKQLFESDTEVKTLFNRAAFGNPLSHRVEELDFFTPADVRQYLDAYCPEDTKSHQAMEQMPGLETMGSHPMMLEIMVQIVPELAGVTERLTKADIFSIYYNKWYGRKKDRRIIARDKLLGFCQELAVALWEKEQPWVPYRVLREKVQGYFNPDDPKAFEHLSRAVSNDSFLTRKGNDWSFMHEAFFHYFLARAVVDDHGEGSILETKKLPNEVLDFLEGISFDPWPFERRLATIKTMAEEKRSSRELTAFANIQRILRCGNGLSLVENLSPALQEKLDQPAFRTVRDIARQTLPSMGFTDSLSLCLVDIVQAFVASHTRFGNLYEPDSSSITRLFCRLAELQNKAAPTTANNWLDLCGLRDKIPKLSGAKNFQTTERFLQNCPEVIELQDVPAGSMKVRFRQAFLFFYFRALSLYMKICDENPTGMGETPLDRETIDWFLEIAPASEKTEADGTKLSWKLTRWLGKSGDEKWQKTVGKYSGSICLSLLSRLDLDPAEWPLKNGFFPESNLEKARFAGLDLTGINLSGSRLGQIDLRKTNLTRAVLTGADLSGASLTSANFKSADLSYAKLNGVFMNRADFSGCNLTGVDFSTAASTEKIVTQGAIIRNTKGL